MAAVSWVYSAYTSTGKRQTGTMTALSAEEVRQFLRKKNLFPESVSCIDELHSDSTPATSRVYLPFDALCRLTTGLSALLESGSDFKSCLVALQQISNDAKTRRVLHTLSELISSGKKVSESLAYFPEVFSESYIAVVRISEINGSFQEAFSSLAESLTTQQEVRRRLRNAMIYPLVMCSVASLVVLFLLAYVLPDLTRMLLDLHQELPITTKLLLAGGQFFQEYQQVLLAVFLLLLLGVYQITRSSKLKQSLEPVLFYIPVIRSFYQTYILYDFAQKMKILLAGRLTFSSALEIMQTASISSVFRQSLVEIVLKLREGQRVAECFQSAPLLNAEFQHFIQVGASSGKFQVAFESLAKLYLKKVDTSIQTTLSLLEPLLILFMGGVIGFIVISVLLPIFQTSQISL